MFDAMINLWFINFSWLVFSDDCASALQTKPIVRSVAQQPNWLAKKAICVANVGWLAGPKPVGSQSALLQGWQLTGERGVQNQHTPNWLADGWCGARAQPTG